MKFQKKLKYSLPLLLLTLFCIVGVEIFYQVLGRQLAGETTPLPQPELQQQQALVRDSRESARPVDIEAITRRNLFSSQESPIAGRQETDPLEGVELSSLDVVLTGTIIGKDEQQRAIIYDRKDRKQELYQEGDFVRDAIIKKILRGKVIINLGGKDEMLDISDARNLNAAYAPPVQPSTTAQRVVSRPLGTTRSASRITPRKVFDPNAAPAATNPKQLRSFRGGITVKGRTADN